MNILILSPFNIQGSKNDPISMNRPTPWVQNLVYALSKYKGIEIHIISGISPKASNSSKYHRTMNVHVYTFKTLGRLSPLFFYLYEIFVIRKYVRIIKPDIIHAQGLESHNGLAAIFSGYPNIVTIHGILNEIHRDDGIRYAPAKFLEKYAVKKSKNIVALNKYVHNILKNYLKNNFAGKKIYYIPNSVSLKYFGIKRRKKINELPNILYCGAFRPRKGLKDLIEILIELSKENYKFKLNITGIIGNDEESELFYREIKEITERWLSNKVVFHGFIQPENMPNLMKKMDLLVHPSKAETAPMVISEAMASWLPVIAYDVGGIKYMIDNGKTGFVVKLNDKKKMKDKIKLLLTDRKLRLALGKKAHEIAEKTYHPDIVAKQTYETYKMVLNKK